jgi:UDP-N-acetylmuramate dehydrogenase
MATNDIQVSLLRDIADLRQSYPLQGFNVLGAGGVADYFTVAHTTIELASAVKAAIDSKVPYLVIGQGSTVLFSDGGFPGLVIKNESSAIAVDKEKSQIVVDSGVSLKQLITAAGNQGLGGLTHLYGEQGTVGGAVYGGCGPARMPLSSSLRFLTILTPPAKIDKEATIARYKGDWLHKEGQISKLYYQKSHQLGGEFQPVILTVLFQLTSVRTDEVLLRLRRQTALNSADVPEGNLMGPVFLPPEGQPLGQVLALAELAGMKAGFITVDRKYPNYLTVRGGVARSADIRGLIEGMQEKVLARTGIMLTCRYEFLGEW